MRIVTAVTLLVTSALTAAGPVSKFDGKTPDASYVSKASIGDVERCLIDLPGMSLPMVYRQPDKPGFVRLIWTNPGISNVAHARVDLQSANGGTSVKAWISEKQIAVCAPR